MTIRSRRCLFWLFTCLTGFCWLAGAIDTPSSTGAAATVDVPILRIPLARKTPKIDGKWEEGEWEDASALSGFWYDRSQADFVFLAPHQTNCSVYACYDKEYLYLAYDTPVYPENSWLKARGRFPDVVGHPLYGQQWDDHVEIELRPIGDRVKGFRKGLFKYYANPINTIVDWYWSQQHGTDDKYVSKLKVRCGVSRKRWVIESRIPLKSLVHKNYVGKENGKPIVTLPPPDGTPWLCWFTRGIGGNGNFFNVFDNHVWNTTKTQLIFDSQAPSIQVNDLGPIMDDMIDVKLTLKNHSTKSQEVRIGFFVESADGNVYSSYNSKKLNGGRAELRPGEVKKIRLQQVFPGISTNGNVLWFDVRAAGRPAKVLFRTRLIEFHSMDGGFYHATEQTFKQKRLDIIQKLRPPRKDFDFWANYSEYTNRVSAIVDLGLHGADPKAQTAKEAKLIIVEDFGEEEVVLEKVKPIKGTFASFLVDLPELKKNQSYVAGVLLFDVNKRIVGEQYMEDPFRTVDLPWKGCKSGLSDTVWDPFVPIRKSADGIETLKHKIDLTDTGLPRQIFIKPDVRDLPLEKRSGGKLTDAELLELGRGPQVKTPFAFSALVGGKRIPARVVKARELKREWKSEHEYVSKLQIGPVTADLTVQYDCDGTFTATLDYVGKAGAKVDGLELTTTIQGLTDLVTWTPGGGMAGAARWDCRLPMAPGVVWDSANQMQKPELYYSRFCPLLWFGSADRAFTYFCDWDRGWMLDKEGSAMSLERAKDGSITWRAKFINHPVTLDGKKRQIRFSFITHPVKSKPKDFRAWGWYHRGQWARMYGETPYDLDDAFLAKEKNIAESGLGPARTRYGFWTSVASISKKSQLTGLFKEVGYNFGGRKGSQNWQDALAYYAGDRWIKQGRWCGFWWDEFWPEFSRSEDVASGYAYLRDPEDVGEKELPWQAGWRISGMRQGNIRLARIARESGVPQRHFYWANHEATLLETAGWDCQLVEECGAGNRSFELDTIVQFPNSLYRYECHNWSGLITRICPDNMPTLPGDDKRLDRQYLGRAMLNDVAASPSGPHGAFVHFSEPMRLLRVIHDFGYFDEKNLEKVPFWRIQKYLTIGKDGKQAADVYVTVYRYPLPQNKGYRALFVIMNEGDEDVELPLTIHDAKRLLGGRNTLTAGQANGTADVPAGLKDWWSKLAARDGKTAVLRDVETDSLVAKQNGDAEVYGPVHVPYRNYRILYGEYRRQ